MVFWRIWVVFVALIGRVMLYFGTCPKWHGASINVAFSTDLVTWHKAQEPLYKAGGHPNGLDQCASTQATLPLLAVIPIDSTRPSLT